MTHNPRPRDMSQQNIFKETDMPPRGFMGELLTLVTHPIEFFKTLGNRQSSPHTLWIAILILLVLSITVLQTSATPANTQQDMGGVPFEEMPFDQGFPPEGGGIVPPESSTSNPTASWTLVLTTIGKEVAQWGALAVLFSLVTLANGYMPSFGKNLEIAIWAAIPMALMAGLQLVFISGGGTITAAGFSGFLDEWATFASLDIRLQSIIHALASQMTLFWLWSIGLLYLGMRYTLRGKLVVVLFTLVMWVALFGLVLSLQSYDALSKMNLVSEDTLPEDYFPEDMNSGEFIPDESFQEGMNSDEFMPDKSLIPMDNPVSEGDNHTGEFSEAVEQVEAPLERK